VRLKRSTGTVESAGQVVAQNGIHGFQPEASVDVESELEASRPCATRGARLDVEVIRRNIGAFDATRGRDRRHPVLVCALFERPDKTREGELLQRPERRQLVGRRQAVRVFVGIVEADDVRIVPRTFDVSSEVALPSG